MIFYYMLIYPVVRFTLEFFRGDAIRGFLFGLSTSQWISLILFGIAVWKLFLSKGKKSKAVCAGLLLVTLFVAGTTPKTVYATEQSASVTAENDEAKQQEIENAEGVLTTGNAPEKDYSLTGKGKFVIFICCLFSVGICLVIAIYGNPNDRLKDKYKRAKKQEMLREKRKKEAEQRAIRRAEEDAKYEKELAEYEAYMKEYEEAKAAKAAAKEAKKAAKRK